MARFKNHCSVPSDHYLQRYFDNGGSVDGGGWSEPVWGFYPSSLASFEEYGIDPSLLGRVFSVIGRVDYGHYDYILEMVRLGLEPRTRKEYGRNCCGISRRILLEKFGVSHNKGVITLGYMSIEKFVRLLLGNATVANPELIESALGYDRWDTFISTEACVAQLSYANGLMKYWINCEIKRRNRRLYENKVQEVTWEKQRNYKLKSKKAIEFCFRTNKPIFIGHIDKKVWVNCSHQTTSIGDVCYMADGIDFSFRGQITGQKRRNTYWSQYDFFFTQAKKLKGYWVARELSLKTNKDVFFIWENSFSDHIEANSLREGLELIQKRIKKKSLILCLNDVRNDRTGTAGYCLAGTKSFAQARMPFMYRLISQYNNWSDIPEEIMSLEFHLASKSIFNGFSNPVS
jgi:hypothetical protein